MHDRDFLIQITSIEEFALFCTLIRGDDLDDAKLREMTARLKKSTTALSDAERADAASRKS